MKPYATHLLSFVLFFFWTSLPLSAQEKMEVSRARAIDFGSKVLSISVDQENNKWVSTDQGLFQVKSPDLSIPVAIPAGSSALYQFPGGNADFSWKTEELNNALGRILSESNTITAAAYDSRKNILWIGTSESGVYEVQTKPALKVLGKVNNNGPKSGAAKTNALLVDALGRTWIGTDAGVFYGTSGKWKQEQKYFSIQSVLQSGSDIWVLGDALLWKVPNSGQWEPVDIPPATTEGDVVAMTADGEGRLWIVSELVAQFDPISGNVKTYGPADYYTTQFPTCAAVDLDGTIWIGSQDKGLYRVGKPSAWAVNIVVEKEISCSSVSNDAALKAVISGGVPPFTYVWNSGPKTDQLTALGPGLYSLTVTDSKGQQKTASVALTDPRVRLTVQATGSETSANAKNGSASATVQGGAAPYSYAWDNGEKTSKAVQLASGSRTVTVTDSKGCTAAGAVEISRDDAPLAVSLVSVKEISCAGKADGGLSVSPSGGSAPFSIAWSQPGIQGMEAKDLKPGLYSLTITDGKGIKADTAFVVKEPVALTATAKISKPASIGGRDGQASLQAAGGTLPYRMQWDNGESGPEATQLAAGKHSVQITDAKGCQTTASLEMQENILPLDVSIRLLDQLKCAGDKTATLEVLVSGGKPPYSYDWKNAGLAGDRPRGLGPGEYSLTVKDASGKQASGNFFVKAPEALSAVIQPIAPASTGNADGRAAVEVRGGTPQYLYAWDNQENQATAAKLAPGKRTVTITDANGCQTSVSVNITENILPLSVAIGSTRPISCAGKPEGALQATISGGKGPFTLQWNQPGVNGEKPANLAAGTYQLTITDATGNKAQAAYELKEPAPLKLVAQIESPASTNQANGKAKASASGGTGPYSYQWDNGEAQSVSQKLAPGKRTVTVTDANGCLTVATVDMTENILPLAASISETNGIACAGEATASLAVEVNGGKGPFTFTWNATQAKGQNPSSLPAGNYQLTVADIAGNTAAASWRVSEPKPLQINLLLEAPASTDQSDGKGRAILAGGTPPVQIQWDNGESGESARQLAPGKHQVTATDSKNCKTTAEIEVGETVLPLRALIKEERPVSCADAKDAVLALEIQGGKKPYRFLWQQGSDNQSIQGLGAGNYRATVSDAIGSSTQVAFTLVSPPPMQLQAGKQTGAGKSPDGQASFTATGGSPPYTFLWDNGEISPDAVRLASGTHQITVTDARGCKSSAEVVIAQRLIFDLVSGKIQPGQSIPLEQVQFEVDSTSFNTASVPMLNELFEFLASNPGVSVEIGGHTSSLCSDEFCERLSAARAKSAADYLVRRGMDPSRVSSKGYGKRFPIADNNTPEGRRKNQRVELKILAVGNP
ncbi:MAG: OmpA family protein [Haliscomenobacter sp.]|nr:OmpA family protein [Haliscomenobacter sp.]